METPATGSSVKQLKTNIKWIQCLAEYTGPKHIIAVPLDRHKAVLASFMRLQEHLLPFGSSLYLQSKTT